jgi:hypothetical protein
VHRLLALPVAAVFLPPAEDLGRLGQDFDVSKQRMHPCAYCGQKGSTKEHVWPRWIRNHALNAMGVDDDNLVTYAATTETRAAVPVEARRRFGHSRLTLTIKRVCRECNNGWMSQLEEAVQPVLTPMIEGRDRELTSGRRAGAAYVGNENGAELCTCKRARLPPPRCATHRIRPLPQALVALSRTECSSLAATYDL